MVYTYKKPVFLVHTLHEHHSLQIDNVYEFRITV